MWLSKSPAVKVLMLIIASFLLNACNLAKPQQQNVGPDRDARSSSFYIDSIEGELLPDDQKTNYSLTSERKFLMKACLKQVALSKSIQNQYFAIEGIQNDVRTDLNGCLQWTETISFNPLLEPTYVLQTRKLTGHTTFKGSLDLKFAVNPWGADDKSKMILDTRNARIPNLVEGADKVEQALFGNKQTTSTDKNTLNRLWVEDGRIFVTEQGFSKNGMRFSVELRSVPSVQLKKANGEPYFRPLTKGSFRGQLSLIHKVEVAGREIFQELALGPVQNIDMISNALAIRSVIELPSLPTRGQLYVGLRLETSSNIGLAPFEGMYLVGEHDRFKGTFFARLYSIVGEEKNFKINNLITTDLTQKEKESLPLQKARIEVAPLEFRYLRVGKETTATRQVVVMVKACLRNGMDQTPIRSHKFKVTKFQQEMRDSSDQIEITTDNASCLVWDETIEFKYYECHRFLPGKVRIQNESLGLDESLGVMINPWEAWSSPGRDLRYVQPSEKQLTQCSDENRLRSQMVLDFFSYNTISYDYEIDNNLNLTMKKKILFKVEPRVLVYSNLSSGRNESERLRDGLYLLKVAIVKNKDYDTGNTYITHDQVIAPALNGTINAELVFKTRDLKALGNRNTILVEVFPVDEQSYKKLGTSDLSAIINKNSGLESATFQGMMTLNLDDANRTLRTTSMDKMKNYFVNFSDVTFSGSIIDSIIQDGQKQLAKIQSLNNSRANAESFAAYSNLKLVRLNDAKAISDFNKLSTINPAKLPHGGWVGSKTTQFNHLFDNAPKGNLKEFSQFIENGTMSSNLHQQLCLFWFFEHFDRLLKAKGANYEKPLAQDAIRHCLNAAKKNSSEFFLTEKRLITKSVRDFKYLKGYNQGITVGNSFSFSNGRTENLSRTNAVSVKAGLSKKYFDLASISLDASYQITHGINDAESETNSINIGAQTSMFVQINQFEVTIGSYEQCVAVRLNPLLFVKDDRSPWWSKKRDLLYILNRSKLSGQDMSSIAHSGYLFCSGVIQNTPIKRNEVYYLIAQEQPQTAMQDNSDERNRNFFIALRGRSEYNKFLVAIKSENSMPVTSTKEEDLTLIQLDHLYKTFTLGLPVFPANYVEHVGL